MASDTVPDMSQWTVAVLLVVTGSRLRPSQIGATLVGFELAPYLDEELNLLVASMIR